MSTLASASTLLTRPVVEAKDLMRKPDHLQAVGGVSFKVDAGKTLAIVGESGCGKSTLARMVSLIETPTAGQLTINGVDAVNASTHERAELRKAVQLVFQNPYGSLNPRKKIGSILEAPLEINTSLSSTERSEKARSMLALVGLRPEHYDRYPHMFSGGRGWLPTRLCLHLTCQFRLRCSTCWLICSSHWGWPIYSFRTTSAWCVILPTMCW